MKIETIKEGDIIEGQFSISNLQNMIKEIRKTQKFPNEKRVPTSRTKSDFKLKILLGHDNKLFVVPE